MIKVRLDPKMVKDAIDIGEGIGVLNRHSYMKGTRNHIGILGEWIVFDFFEQAKYSVKHVDEFDYDLLVGDAKVEVKSKQVTSIPQPDYDATLTTYYDQVCDMFVFVRIHENLKFAWILGYSEYEEFGKIAKVVEAGTIRGSNKLKFKKRSLVVTIDQLYKMEDLIC